MSNKDNLVDDCIDKNTMQGSLTTIRRSVGTSNDMHINNQQTEFGSALVRSESGYDPSQGVFVIILFLFFTYNLYLTIFR